MIRYRYAINEHGNVLSIDNITEKNKNKIFTCGGCGERLSPRALKSNKVIPHFYHPYDESFSQRECSGETYLHWISKELLAESFQQSGPFVLEWKSTSSCIHEDADWTMCYKEHEHFMNLTKEYPIVTVEKKDGDFIPDILLSNKNGGKIYVEICNSSTCSIEKRNSGNKIIEIKVKNEEDIEKIVRSRTIDGGYAHIDYSYTNIELINFALDEAEGYFDCKGKCPHMSEEEPNPILEKEQDIPTISTNPTTEELESIGFISEQAISFMEAFFDIDRDDDNTIIIEILNRMWYFYQAGIEAIKSRIPIVAAINSLEILYRGNGSQFTFLIYNGKYYGIVFLEYKYFLYHVESNKVFIVCQLKNIEAASDAIDELRNAF